MSGLVAYASSDEGDDEKSGRVPEACGPSSPFPRAAPDWPWPLPLRINAHRRDEIQAPPGEAQNKVAGPRESTGPSAERENAPCLPSAAAAEPAQPEPSRVSASLPEVTPPPAAAASPAVPPVGPVTQSAVPIGPSLPPAEERDATAGGVVDDDGHADGAGPGEAPPSPYTAARALIHDLTLPAVPNLDIPPSPPGSPSSRLTKTFERFLALKKQGVHFNAKLEQSSALKNPSAMDKLMEYAGLHGEKQYETTLSHDLWNPAALPEFAYVDRLKQTREKLAKRIETARPAAGTRTSVDFVPATAPAAGADAPSAAGGLARGEKRKSDWK